MDPKKTQFTVAHTTPHDPMEGCAGCVFEHERSSICAVAQHQAALRGLALCEYPDPDGRSIIYVRVAVDPRQVDLFQE